MVQVKSIPIFLTLLLAAIVTLAEVNDLHDEIVGEFDLEQLISEDFDSDSRDDFTGPIFDGTITAQTYISGHVARMTNLLVGHPSNQINTKNSLPILYCSLKISCG